MLSHFRRAAALRSARHKAATSSGDGVKVRDLLPRAATLEEATQIICMALFGKISALLMIPVEEIRAHEAMRHCGLVPLVVVEMRNWISGEMNASVPILEPLANQSLEKLAEKIVARLKVVKFGKGIGEVKD